MKITFNCLENNFLKFSLRCSLLIGILLLSVSCHSIGNYPQVKKLNNGKYIVASLTNIIFFDSTLMNEENIFYINNTENDYYFIEQFSHEDGDYIIALSRNYTYIFSQSGTKLNITSHDLFNVEEYNTYSCSIIPYNSHYNEKYFFIIYYNPIVTEELYYVKGIFDSVSYSITFSEQGVINGHNYISSSFSCSLIKYNGRNVVNFFYGNGATNYVMHFYPDENFSIVDDLPIITLSCEGYNNIYKSIFLPGKEKVILCSYTYSNVFCCFQYDVSLKTIVKEKKIKNNAHLSNTNKMFFFLEYYSETDEILLGYTFNNNIIYIIQCTTDLQCSDMKEIIFSEYSYDIGYPNIVVPFGQNKYQYFFYHEMLPSVCEHPAKL